MYYKLGNTDLDVWFCSEEHAEAWCEFHGTFIVDCVGPTIRSEIERLHFDAVLTLLWDEDNRDHDKLETALVSMKMAVAHSSDNMELLDELEFLIENRSIRK